MHGARQVVCVLNDLGLPRDPAIRTQEVVRRLKLQGAAGPKIILNSCRGLGHCKDRVS